MRNVKNRKKYIVPFVIIKGNTHMPLLGSSTTQQMKLIEVKHENIAVTINENCTVSSGTQVTYTQHEHARDKEAVEHQSKLTRISKTKEEIFRDHACVFKGLGHMPGKVRLQIKPDTQPVIMPPRRVPIAIKPKLKEELERLEQLEVIKKVEGPTDWVSSLVNVVKPSGRLRVCIDPQHLNQALKRDHYPLPVIDDVLPKLAKVKIFSKADCREGFLQCELDEESSHLTTCQTPWGRYTCRWCRLPFGLSPSPELFQMKLEQCLEGLTCIHTIADDILITGQGEIYEEAELDHDRNMTILQSL